MHYDNESNVKLIIYCVSIECDRPGPGNASRMEQVDSEWYWQCDIHKTSSSNPFYASLADTLHTMGMI